MFQTVCFDEKFSCRIFGFSALATNATTATAIKKDKKTRDTSSADTSESSEGGADRLVALKVCDDDEMLLQCVSG